MDKDKRFSTTDMNYFDIINRALIKLRRRRSEQGIGPSLDEPIATKQPTPMHPQDTLFQSSSMFPFMLFPDSISMDRHQLTIVHRSFFRTEDKIVIQTSDILSAESNVGPFFGSLHIYSNYSINNVDRIYYLSRKDTLSIQRLVQGYIIAQREKIDCSILEKAPLIRMLNSLGGAS